MWVVLVIPGLVRRSTDGRNIAPIGCRHDAQSRNAGLDLLRGVAVGLVMLRHAWPDTFGGAGIVGVTIFFALSGYLITGLLARDIERQGAPRWGRFYAHRFFRLMPALLLLLALYALVETIWEPLGRRDSVVETVIVGVTYTSDLPVGLDPGALTHLWSLAIEEQFYLVWPAVLWFAARRKIGLGRMAVISMVGLTLACWATLAIANSPDALYTRPTTWASVMAIGAVAKLYENKLRAATAGYLNPLAVVAAAVLASLALVPDAKDQAWTYLAWPTLIGVSSAVLIFKATAWATLPNALRAGAWLGLISYGVYLWNLLIVQWFEEALGSPTAWQMTATLPLTILAALVSWYTVEAAGRRMREKFDARTTQRSDALVRSSLDSPA